MGPISSCHDDRNDADPQTAGPVPVAGCKEEGKSTCWWRDASLYLFKHIFLNPETLCYLDYDSDRACSVGPNPTPGSVGTVTTVPTVYAVTTLDTVTTVSAVTRTCQFPLDLECVL